MHHVDRCGRLGLRRKGANRPVGRMPQPRIGLPTLPESSDRGSDEVAVLNALCGTDIDELLS
jgi:hypothetical protein